MEVAANDTGDAAVELYYTEGQQTAIRVVSALSMIVSLAYPISFLVFYKEMSKRASNIFLFFIFLSDALNGSGSIVGLPNQANVACWWEGIVTNLFGLSGIMWTVMLTFLLYSIVVLEKPIKPDWGHFLVCFGVPIVATFIPLTNTTYGPPEGEGWCWIVATESSPEWAEPLWFWLSFYLWIWGSVVVMGFMLLAIFIKVLKIAKDATNKSSQSLLRTTNLLMGYPVIIIMLWLPACCTDALDYFGSEITIDNPTYDTATYGTSLLICFIGLLNSCVFWYAEETVPQMWRDLREAGWSLETMRDAKKKGADSERGSKKVTKKATAAKSAASSMASTASTRSVYDHKTESYSVVEMVGDGAGEDDDEGAESHRAKKVSV